MDLKVRIWKIVFLLATFFFFFFSVGGFHFLSGRDFALADSIRQAILGTATTVGGKIFAPNGTDPISSAVVYIPSSGNLINGTVQVDCGDKGGVVTCAAPSENACAASCSCSNGSYSLNASACSPNSDSIKYCKGSFCGTAALACNGSSPASFLAQGGACGSKAEAQSSSVCSVDITGSKVTPGIPNIAVVTGPFDQMENVLAKLGLGKIDSNGGLVVGSESFDMYRGGGSIDITLAQDPSRYPESSVLFGNLAKMSKYDIIFLNCGTDETPLNAASEARILEYVKKGGILYATDWAYDFIDQSISNFMKFKGDPSNPSDPKPPAGGAKVGDFNIVSDSTVNNSLMSSWLKSISSNTIPSTPGDLTPNSSFCSTTVDGHGSSLEDSGKIRIGDFLPGWVVMDQPYDASTFVWISGPISFNSGTSATRPLTASRKVSQGCVVYSSDHTSHSCPTVGFWPQERVLQYLIFESGGTCVP